MNEIKRICLAEKCAGEGKFSGDIFPLGARRVVFLLLKRRFVNREVRMGEFSAIWFS